MAIDKYSGLSQSEKFYARYGKSVGNNTVNRQKLHLASEAVKNEARAKLQLPNYAAKAQKPLLKLPNLNGGVYETASRNVTVNDLERTIRNKLQRAAKGGKAFDIDAFIKSNPLLNRDANAKEELIKRLGINVNESTSGAATKAISKFSEAGTSAGTATTSSTVGASSKSIKGLLPAPESSGAKGFIGGIADNLKAFAKTKKGKIGLAAAAAAALLTGGIYLYKRNKKDVTPISDSSPVNDLAKVPVNGQMSANGPYTVAKGDNIWNIARAHLMELHKDEKDYNPTDVQILQRTEEIMKLNDLHYEKDNYRVIIKPDQQLKLVA